MPSARTFVRVLTPPNYNLGGSTQLRWDRKIEIVRLASAYFLLRNACHLQQDRIACSRTQRLERMFQDETGVFIAVTDYMAALAQGVAAWMPPNFEVLGTDGYGLSESRTRLRQHFSVMLWHLPRGRSVNYTGTDCLIGADLSRRCMGCVAVNKLRF